MLDPRLRGHRHRIGCHDPRGDGAGSGTRRSDITVRDHADQAFPGHDGHVPDAVLLHQASHAAAGRLGPDGQHPARHHLCHHDHDHAVLPARYGAGHASSLAPSAIGRTSRETFRSASVARSTSATPTPGAVSSTVARPSGNPMTASSVTTRSTARADVRGRRHFATIFDLPFAVCCMATITRLAPETRSIAPPMPGTILPGIIQLARCPCESTCRPPRTVTSTWPPRINPNDIALSKVLAPGRALIGRPPASVSRG